jgi:hypothetical protein
MHALKLTYENLFSVDGKLSDLSDCGGFFFFFLWYWSLNVGLHLEPFFVTGVFEMGSHELFVQLASNLNPPVSATCVARITGLSHWCLGVIVLTITIYIFLMLFALNPF